MSFESVQFEGILCLRILAACICGCVVGYERTNRYKEAGIRTHAIVALGAAMIMIISKYGFSDVNSYDAARVAAQIVSGVGFLGAGIIFVRNQSISGLTTAAGIWATSGIGMAIGAGLYIIGVVSTVLILLVQVVMHRKFFVTKEPMREHLYFVVADGEEGIHYIQKILKKHQIQVTNIKMERKKEKTIQIEVEVIVPVALNQMQLLEQLLKQDVILSVRSAK
ncbi:MgtC/SapB family protein [Velocimicrobium porci]|uniref:MgtC/SapB family protein n=1 Tax=Velocimicrobium porci TaxID=2606634 RepID=A0A6L5Y1B3_9FIRM|nr:MgtC/SapB family protein [Velocimicrobium porci]MSS64198.1 MgtC/SapB family protein [Velocimicrobium porci]